MSHNLDHYIEQHRIARQKLIEYLHTERGTQEAREESAIRRSRAYVDAKCQCCGADISRPVKTSYCMACESRLSRLKLFKSILKAKVLRRAALESFIEDYSSCENLPYSLRGNVPREQIIAQARELQECSVAVHKAFEDELKRL